MMALTISLIVVAFAGGSCAGLLLARARAQPAPTNPEQPTTTTATAAAGNDPSRRDPARHDAGLHLPTLSSHVVAELVSGVVVVDANDRVVLVNPAARAMDVVNVDQLAFEPMQELVQRVRSSGSRVQSVVELPIGRLGREPIALTVTAVTLNDAGSDAKGTVGLLLVDVSEQRRLEAVRRDFVANVSHELKTPVGAMTLLAEAIQDAADDPEVVARFAKRLQHEGARLTRLVQEIMQLSRVQGMDPMPGAEEVSVSTLLAESLDRSGLDAEREGVEVQSHCEPGLTVRGSQAQLIAAVTNLVDNAIGYSGTGTSVSVTARGTVDRQARPIVEIAVVDQGIGIEEAELNRVFERFYRVDPARSRVTGGTGLGLAIVRNIVTNHLGSVTVRSVPGKGSTFTIRLPRVYSDGPSLAPSAEDSVKAKGTA